MFSRILTQKSILTYSEQIEQVRQALHEADAVVIGAGAGLSTSAGLTYSGPGSRNTSETSFRNIKSRICIPAVFILLKLWKNIGHGGAARS